MTGFRKAVLFATAEQQIVLGSNFIVAIVTSRVMAPHEIGIAVLGTAIVHVITALREYAASTYLIKNADLSPNDLKGALTGMICWNALLTIGLAAAAPAFGHFYGDERVVVFLRIVALAIMAEAFAMPVIAILRKDMEFDKSAAVVTAGTIMMLVSTLGMTFAGLGYLSFALGLLAGYTTSALVGVLIRPTFWLFRPRFQSWRALFVFGGFNGSNTLLRDLYDLLPYLVLGRILSLESVAFFHRALMLSQLPGKLILTGIENVMLPVLKKSEGSAGGLKNAFLRTISLVTGVYWPTLIVAAILAEPLVSLLYGPAFLPAVPLFQIMAFAALFAFIGKLDSALLVAAGGLGDLLRRGLIAYPLSLVISTASAFSGVISLSLSYWLTYPLQLATSLYFIRRHIAFSWSDLASATSVSAVAATASAIGPVAFAFAFNGGGWSQAAFVSAGVTAIAGWLVVLWLMRHPLLAEALRRDETRSDAAAASGVVRRFVQRFR
jgi:O-antigen/teichoic acid export membrane protein